MTLLFRSGKHDKLHKDSIRISNVHEGPRVFRVIDNLRWGEEIYALCLTVVLYTVNVIAVEANLEIAKITPLDTKRYRSSAGFEDFEELDHAAAVAILEQATSNLGAYASGYLVD